MNTYNELNVTELRALYNDATTAEKGQITRAINAIEQSDETGVLEGISNQEQENIGLTAIQEELKEYFREEVNHMKDSNNLLSTIACDLYDQYQNGDDYCIELVQTAPDYVQNTLPEGVDSDIWRQKMISLVYPNYAHLLNDYSNKSTQSKGSPANSQPVQDTERALQMVKAVDNAWKKLLQVLAWFEVNKAIDVFYNTPLKLISANLWQSGQDDDGKVVEGNLSPALYYVTAIMKSAPKPAQSTSEKSVGNKKAKDLDWLEKIALVKDLITANNKPALPKNLFSEDGLPILEALENLRETIEAAVNEDVLTLMHNLKDAQNVNAENEIIANRIASAITEGEADDLEGNDLDDLETAQQAVANNG